MPESGQKQETMTDIETDVITPEIEAEIDDQAALAEADVQPTDTIPPVVVPARELTDAEIDAEIAKRGYVKPQPVQQAPRQVETRAQAFERIKEEVSASKGWEDPVEIARVYGDYQADQLSATVQANQEYAQIQAVRPAVEQALEAAGVPKEQANYLPWAKTQISREACLDENGHYSPSLHNFKATQLLAGIHTTTQGPIPPADVKRKAMNPEPDSGAPVNTSGLGLSGQEAKDYNSWHEMWYSGKPKTAATIKQYRELDK